MTTEERNQLVLENMGLVYRVALSFPRHVWRGLELDDLANFGAIGLIHAIEKYDPSRGTVLSTYAVPWIRMYITRGIDSQNPIYIPVHAHEKRRRILSIRASYQRRGINPTAEEIAGDAGLTLSLVKALLHSLELRYPSLDAPLSDDVEAESLVEIVPDGAPGPADVAVANDDRTRLHARLRTAAERLPSHQRRLMLYYLEGGDDSCAAIARRLGVTRQCVRERRNLAFKRLRKELTA